MTKNRTGQQISSLSICKCGCGEGVRSNYRPGHDARHIAFLFTEITEGRMLARRAPSLLPTDALRNKLARRLADHAAK